MVDPQISNGRKIEEIVEEKMPNYFDNVAVKIGQGAAQIISYVHFLPTQMRLDINDNYMKPKCKDDENAYNFGRTLGGLFLTGEFLIGASYGIEKYGLKTLLFPVATNLVSAFYEYCRYVANSEKKKNTN